MAEFPTYEQMAKNVAEKALDEFLYDGKSIREWMKIIVEQEPKIGHWEWVQYNYNPHLGNWHCSECRCVVVECVGKEEKGGIPLYKYCPQCGAKMEVSE